MAKKTKDSNHSIEERLEQTVVPNWDYPYIIPQNWVFFWFTKLINIEGGTQPPKSQFIDCELDGYVRLVQIRDFSSDKYIVFVPDSNKLRHFNENDILIARYGASLGKICTGLKGVYNVALAKTIFSEKVLNRKYVYWMLHSESFQNPLMTISRTAQAGFNKDDLSRFAMPLPPLAEQQRIVEHIESFFEKLDEAKEKAQEVVDGFETRKAAILHKAFSGELTAKWREENNISFEEWTTCSLSTCCKIGSGGTPSRKNSEYYTGDIPWIKTGEIEWNEVVDSEEKISQEAIDNSSAKLYNPGAVLVAMYGMGVTRGRAAILGVKAATNQAVCVLQPQEYLNNRYLFYFFMCNYWSVREQAVGGNQLNLSATIIGKLNINIPSVSEQIEIVRVLDNLISKEQVAKETAEAVIEQIETMKKAILARAFRGELGTNDPNEESALELLKNFLGGDVVSHVSEKKPIKRNSIPSDIKHLLSNKHEEEIIKLLLKSAPHSVSIQAIMSISSKKFELMDALRALEKKQLIIKNESSQYLLTR